MDQQDPRLTAERLSGRGTDETIGYENTAGERRSSTTATRRSAGISPAPPTNEYDSPVTEPDVEQRTRDIRADIEQTREDLSETVSAIQDRLRPSTVASNAVERIKASATDAASEVADSQPVRYVSANPIPSAMVGVGIVGLAWLALRGRDGRGSMSTGASGRSRSPQAWPAREMPYEQSTTEYGRPLASTGSMYGSEATGGAESTYGQSSYGQSSYGSRGGSMRGQNALTRTWNETPLLIGAAAALAGAMVGLSIPETERERQLMGETRDRLLETAQRTVQDKVTRVQDAATEAVGRVQEVAKDVTGLTGDRS